jgi:hypothetical protein
VEINFARSKFGRSEDGYGNGEPPAPGNLIAMGCKTWHMKDFFQRLKSAEEIINLIKASVLYYSLHPPNSNAPRMIEYRSPCFFLDICVVLVPP